VLIFVKIINLKLRNLKRFLNEDISFDRPLNVLVGKNNSGKSTLLEALADLSLAKRTSSIMRNKKLRGSQPVQLELCFQLSKSDWKKVISSRFKRACYTYSYGICSMYNGMYLQRVVGNNMWKRNVFANRMWSIPTVQSLFLIRVNPIRELLSQRGQWDLNLAGKWVQLQYIH
jgi:predicted ATPase